MSLRDYYPAFLTAQSLFGQMLDATQPEFDALQTDHVDLINQFFVSTATWGLNQWEQFTGITTDASKPYDQRRSLVKSKLAGAGTTTIQMLKDMSLAFANGEISVAEYPAENRFVITFIGPHGVPPNITDYQNAVYQVQPAHLGVTYVFHFLIWSELDAKAITWAALDAKALTWANFELGGWLDA